MNGKGGNNRRKPVKGRDNDTWQEVQKRGKKSGDNARYGKSRGSMYERPRWMPPVLSREPLPVPDCPYCGKPIKDIAVALNDRNSGAPVHFDCVIARIGGGEVLEKGDAITYIGGGRFGIIHFDGPQHLRVFTIKKIFEWEDKENRAEWRKSISEHYSVT
ncbi:MAG: hypothetical protein LBT14_01135 [Treponema sp.]|jgi:hypothetical protein|nr:hypothetical protein [Treponema sp.]